MNIEIENNQLRISKVFKPIKLVTPEGESLELCIRDGRFQRNTRILCWVNIATQKEIEEQVIALEIEQQSPPTKELDKGEEKTNKNTTFLKVENATLRWAVSVLRQENEDLNFKIKLFEDKMQLFDDLITLNSIL